MKRGYLQTILITLLSVQLTLAQNYYIDNSIRSMGQAIGSLFAPLFGVGFGEFLFAKIMLFFLLFAVIFAALKKVELFDDNKAVHIIVTSVTAILAVRYLSPGEFINAILLPYSALGASIATLIPFIVFFYFVHKSGIGPFGRRGAWITYGIFFLMLWGTRPYDTLGSANWAYAAGALFILVSLIFDKSIHQYFEVGRYNKAKRNIIEQRIVSLQNSIAQARNVGNHHLADDWEKEIKKLVKKL